MTARLLPVTSTLMSQPYLAAFVRLEWKPMVSLNDAVVNVPRSGVKGSGFIALVDVM